MIRTPQARATILATALLTAGILMFGATPATAAPSDAKPSNNACWLNLDNGVTQCFANHDALEDAVLEQTGLPLLTADEVVAGRGVTPLATFVLATFFADASYGGGSTNATSSSSTTCTAGSTGANLTAFNNVTSSFKSFFGCSTKIWDNFGQAGSSFGFAVNAPTVGAMNDLASSFTLT
jgi:hypothetical protein